MKYFSFLTEEKLNKLVEQKLSHAMAKMNGRIELLRNRVKNLECRLDPKAEKPKKKTKSDSAKAASRVEQ